MKKFELNSTMLETKDIKKSGWKMIGLCYLLYIVILVVCNMIFKDKPRIISILVGYTISVPICVGFMVKIGKRTLSSLGMNKGKTLLRYVIGWLIALAFLAVVQSINILSGGVNAQINKDFNLFVFLLLLIGFIFQGFMEEFLLRSLLCTQFAVKWSVAAGVILNSIIFGLGHMRNASASPLSVVNTVLIGILFSLIFYYHDNLWLVSGFHSGWNFILGPVLGIIVSGFELPTSILITNSDLTKTLLNGGKYGFEAGLPVTIITTLLIIGYLVRIMNKPFPK